MRILDSWGVKVVAVVSLYSNVSLGYWMGGCLAMEDIVQLGWIILGLLYPVSVVRYVL